MHFFRHVLYVFRSHPRIITPDGHFYLYSSTDPVLDWSLRLVQNSFFRKLKTYLNLNIYFKNSSMWRYVVLLFNFYINFNPTNVFSKYANLVI